MEDKDNEERGIGRQRFSNRPCRFPGCGVIFYGRGKAKYCEEHKQEKYRKELYNLPDNDGNGVVRIFHEYLSATEEVICCGLQGCDNEYAIVLLPGVSVYPNYCEEHRNEYKRTKFLKTQELEAEDDN